MGSAPADPPARGGRDGPTGSTPGTPLRILVTGASAGIGQAIAEILSAEGHRVWGTSRAVGPSQTTAKFHPLALDLADPASVEQCAREALEAAGGALDVLINNAGSGVFGPVAETEPAWLARQFQILVFGPAQLIRLLLPAMRGQGRGLIINVTSLAAEFPIPFMGAYSAAKAALSSLSWALSMELAGSPIRIVDLRPGDIRTGFNDRLEHVPLEAQAPYRDNLARAFAVYEARMRSAPPPALVAQRVLDIVRSGSVPPGRVNVGTWFQAQLAPLLAKLLPHALIRFGVNRYYRLRS
jgi:NAD(P)-dependent dehydrogenase (short-subunit alcohol dehydrogenase family)